MIYRRQINREVRLPEFISSPFDGRQVMQSSFKPPTTSKTKLHFTTLEMQARTLFLFDFVVLQSEKYCAPREVSGCKTYLLCKPKRADAATLENDLKILFSRCGTNLAACGGGGKKSSGGKVADSLKES
uniref:Uncharacterized protein n=1 Tax=Steinernema glaseri TaxID=37863 RepID=A0A1I7ZJM6_9BILA